MGNVIGTIGEYAVLIIVVAGFLVLAYFAVDRDKGRALIAKIKGWFGK